MKFTASAKNFFSSSTVYASSLNTVIFWPLLGFVFVPFTGKRRFANIDAKINNNMPDLIIYFGSSAFSKILQAILDSLSQ